MILSPQFGKDLDPKVLALFLTDWFFQFIEILLGNNIGSTYSLLDVGTVR